MPKQPLSNAVKIGVSACLLGQAVRYDGMDKRNSIVTDVLCQQFECVPVCPEMAIGLGSPRPPVQLVKTANGMRAIGRDDPAVDITDRMVEYSRDTSFGQLSGFILKSRSPSCGIGSTPIFNIDHLEIEKGNGLFADAIIRRYKKIPVIEDNDLDDEDLLTDFISKVRAG